MTDPGATSGGVTAFDALPDYDAAPLLGTCCGSHAWVQAMLERRPFRSLMRILDDAEEIWWSLAPGDWREAVWRFAGLGGLAELKLVSRREVGTHRTAGEVEVAWARLTQAR